MDGVGMISNDAERDYSKFLKMCIRFSALFSTTFLWLSYVISIVSTIICGDLQSVNRRVAFSLDFMSMDHMR